MTDLFPNDRHDAGGKVKTRLPAGMRGNATFWGDRDEYRPVLARWTGGPHFPDRYALFIGMNPSTAAADINDPTITREWGFAVREGYSAYMKCNLSDYRATNPKDLLEPGLRLQSPANQSVIRAMTRAAGLVIVCWGAVNRALQPLADDLASVLEEDGVEMYCLGTTASGAPRHPLYLPKDAPLQKWPS